MECLLHFKKPVAVTPSKNGYVCLVLNQNVRFYLVLTAILFHWTAQAQHALMPHSPLSSFYLDRLDISGQTNGFISSLKPVSRIDLFPNSANAGQGITKEAYRYLRADNMGYPFFDTLRETTSASTPWKGFRHRLYHRPCALFSVNTNDLILIINPVINLAAGKALDEENTFQNTRGAEIRGTIDQRVGFYSMLTSNLISFPAYYQQMIDSFRVIPGEGYHVKDNQGAQDFFQARGYVTFKATRHIAMQLGHDRNFIGNGYRSLILSDFSKDYSFLKINTRVWKFNYQNLFTQLTDYTRQSATGKGIKPKYMVNHYLGMNLFRNVQIGVFESVVYDRGDSTKKGPIDLNYLNPVIFYRAIEHNLNSSDNVLVGLDWKWNIYKRVSLYGQFVLDELAKKELINRTQWWGNKYAIQTGCKFIGAFGLNGLDLQAEYNLVRPYTYSHFKLSQTYVNYDQPLAHPMGSNFREYLVLAKFQPAYPWFVQAGFIHAVKGMDSSSTGRHFGGNILTTYDRRPKEYDVTIGQGVKTTYQILFVNASWMMYHNLWLDARLHLRKTDSGLSYLNNNLTWFQLGIRMNIQPRAYDF